MRVSDKIKRVRENIHMAEKRGFGEVKLLAVTKGVSVERVKEALDTGQKLFGENYVQEALAKIEALGGSDIEWHFIGGLQTNKVGKCIGRFGMIETVDRINLALEIDKQASKRAIRDYPVLLEINLAGESTKSGAPPGKVFELIEKISRLETIRIKGLMTVPPFSSNPEDSRPYFSRLRDLSEKIKSMKFDRVDMEELSMGMSGDYAVAVEEGATIVRVGTAIFGDRSL